MKLKLKNKGTYKDAIDEIFDIYFNRSYELCHKKQCRKCEVKLACEFMRELFNLLAKNTDFYD